MTSFAHRGNHVLLFSPDFIEVRNINTGRLVQVIEGTDQRLLHCGQEEDARNSILIAMKGSKDDQDGVSDKITELVETCGDCDTVNCYSTTGAYLGRMGHGTRKIS